jgi:hypothetical protein
VVCQFGVMFFPDRTGASGEVFRVLRPGGDFVFNVWDKIELNGFAQTVSQAVAERFPADPPSFMVRTPHGYNDVEMIAAELAGAGFADVRIETVTEQSHAPSHRDPAIGFCQGAPLRAEIEARDPQGLQATTDAAARRSPRDTAPDPCKLRCRLTSSRRAGLNAVRVSRSSA